MPIPVKKATPPIADTMHRSCHSPLDETPPTFLQIAFFSIPMILAHFMISNHILYPLNITALSISWQAT
jgi:hypothetical protein